MLGSPTGYSIRSIQTGVSLRDRGAYFGVCFSNLPEFSKLLWSEQTIQHLTPLSGSQD